MFSVIHIQTYYLLEAENRIVLLISPNKLFQLSRISFLSRIVADDNPINNILSEPLQMGWVMNEVLRLYCPAPNVQRQVREDIHIDGTTIPKGTNIWIDLVSMHHDPTLWGEDVNEFKPERFRGDASGGCRHSMGFSPFGFGVRMCIGRNFTVIVYKTLLTSILSRFSVSLSPTYRHSPSILLSLRPASGLPLILHPP